MQAMLSALLSLIFLSCHLPNQQTMKECETFLSAKETHFRLSDNKIELLFTVANHKAEEFRFCQYGTPFEGLTGGYMEVTGPDGTQMNYTGIMVKRGEPTEADYLNVQARSMRSTWIELSDSYAFEKTGTYRIRFVGNKYMNELPDSNVLEIRME